MTLASDRIILAAESEAGGAALDQVLGLSAAAGVVTLVLLWIGYQHRARKITWLNDFAGRTGTKFNRPPWVALQVFLFTATIICALFGFIWDVGLHIGKGRDSGPLANPAHYFILFGLFLLFIAGALSVTLPYDKPGSAAVRITRKWFAPVGGLLMTACGLYALIGFPLDDVWHRLFGQDVTLWGPTHLMLIGGAGLSLIAVLLLEYEGRRSMGSEAPPDRWFLKFVQYLSFGGLLIGMSVYQIEYDFGVEQFRLVLQPMMIAAAAALALIAARLVLGRGAAIIAALIAIALRGAVALVVGPVLGAPISWFPLYLGPAIVVELLALTPLIKRHLLFGVVGGLLVATVGLWAESFWIAGVYHLPWPTSMWGEALAMAIPVAVFMGICGAMLGMVLTGTPLPRPAIGITLVVLTVLVTGGAVANGLRTEVPENAGATIALTDLPSADGQRMVSADVRIDPPDLVSENPEWVTILAWQGGLENHRGLVVDRLNQVGPGHYQSTMPIPVWGSWKTLLRVQDGTTMAGVPIFLAGDPGIGAQEVPAEANITRNFVPEITILQRERNFDLPSWLFTAASIVVLICTLILIAALTWGAGRINGTEPQPARREDTRPRVSPGT
ncbi:MAG: hypothetical protein ABWY45_22060 [Mycobacterium sp.]